MNVAIKVTEAGTTLGHPMLTPEQIVKLNKEGRCFHFILLNVPDEMPRSAALRQFEKIAPCHAWSKERREKYALPASGYIFDSPQYLYDEAVYEWCEIAGQPQGAMIF